MKKLILIPFIILAFACKKKNETVTPEDPVVKCFKSPLNISASNVDLNIKADTLTASFPSAVDYTLTLTGKSSGAVKSYSGNSDTFSIIWMGENENKKSFLSEEVEIKLVIPCITITKTITIKPNLIYACANLKSNLQSSSSNADLDIRPDTITASFSNSVHYALTIVGKTSGASKTYEGLSDTIGIIWKGESDNSRFFISEDVNITLNYTCGSPVTKTISIQPYDWSKDGVMISDFDGKGYVTNSFTLGGFNATGWSSYYSSPNVISKFQVESSPLTAPQGTNYLTVKGTAGSQSWFVGTTSINAPNSLPDNNPDNLFFNVFVNGDNYPPLLSFVLTVSGKSYQYILPVNWTGWKQVSLKFSDFKSSVGSTIGDVSKLTAIDIGLNCANEAGETLEANFDYMIITKDKPLFK